MIDAINRLIGYFVRPANQPKLWIDRAVRRFRPRFRTSIAANSVYSFGLIALAGWASTLRPTQSFQAIVLDIVILYLLVATEAEAVWKGVLLASRRPAMIYDRMPSDDRIIPSPKSLFLGVGGFGCTILCFASTAFFLHVKAFAHYNDVPCAATNLRSWWDFFYFSATTITTIGLSPIHPADPLSQALALVEIALGLFFVIFVFAAFVSLHTAARR
jgi:hypothetical protein